MINGYMVMIKLPNSTLRDVNDMLVLIWSDAALLRSVEWWHFFALVALFNQIPSFQDSRTYLDCLDLDINYWHLKMICPALTTTDKHHFPLDAAAYPSSSHLPSLFYVWVYLYEDLAATPQGAKLLLGGMACIVGWRNASTSWVWFTQPVFPRATQKKKEERSTTCNGSPGVDEITII